jgi:hypothetical protein
VGAHVQGAFTSESDHCNLRRLGEYCLTGGRVCLVSSVLVFVKYIHLRHYAEFFNTKPSGTQFNHGALELSIKSALFVLVMLPCIVSMSGLFSDAAYLDYIGLVLDE